MNPQLQKRILKLLWVQIVKVPNPWLDGRDDDFRVAWEERNLDKIGLTREMSKVLFGNAVPSEDLIERGLDFLGVEKYE